MFGCSERGLSTERRKQDSGAVFRSRFETTVYNRNVYKKEGIGCLPECSGNEFLGGVPEDQTENMKKWTLHARVILLKMELQGRSGIPEWFSRHCWECVKGNSRENRCEKVEDLFFATELRWEGEGKGRGVTVRGRNFLGEGAELMYSL